MIVTDKTVGKPMKVADIPMGCWFKPTNTKDSNNNLYRKVNPSTLGKFVNKMNNGSSVLEVDLSQLGENRLAMRVADGAIIVFNDDVLVAIVDVEVTILNYVH